MKNFLKSLLYFATGLLLLSIVAMLIIFRNLPSSQVVLKSLRPKTIQAQSSVVPRAEPAQKNTPPKISQSKSGAPLPDLGPQPLPEKQETQEVLADFLINPERPLLNICENLQKSADSKIKSGEKDIFAVLEESVKADPEDPLANAIALPIRYALRLPKIQEFLAEAEQQQEPGENEDFIKKVSFYKKAIAALQELQQNEEEINDVGRYAYQLYVMSRMVKENPNLARDPSVLDFCEQNQKAVAQNEKFNKQLMAEQMLSLLEFAKIPPEKIEYEPEIKSEFTFNITGTSIQIGLGWINKLIRPAVTPPNSNETN